MESPWNSQPCYEPADSFMSAIQFWALLATCAYIGVIHQMYERCDGQCELENIRKSNEPPRVAFVAKLLAKL